MSMHQSYCTVYSVACTNDHTLVTHPRSPQPPDCQPRNSRALHAGHATKHNGDTPETISQFTIGAHTGHTRSHHTHTRQLMTATVKPTVTHLERLSSAFMTASLASSPAGLPNVLMKSQAGSPLGKSRGEG